LSKCVTTPGSKRKY